MPTKLTDQNIYKYSKIDYQDYWYFWRHSISFHVYRRSAHEYWVEHFYAHSLVFKMHLHFLFFEIFCDCVFRQKEIRFPVKFNHINRKWFFPFILIQEFVVSRFCSDCSLNIIANSIYLIEKNNNAWHPWACTIVRPAMNDHEIFQKMAFYRKMC